MINMKLEVEDYCQSCKVFTATYEQIDTHTGLGNIYNDFCSNVIIKCKYEDHCKNMKEYLSKTKSKEDSEC